MYYKIRAPSHSRYAGESHDVRQHTHSKDEQFLSLPQILRELVHHGRNEALHGAKLGVQAEEEQHEEEAAGPEWRERHLKDSAGVGQESEAGAWK